jgi:KDO2-lipid IV(A) lauroyltransferase
VVSLPDDVPSDGANAIGVGGYAALVGLRLAGAVVPRTPLPVLRAAADLAGAAGYALGAGARRGGASNLSAVIDRRDPELVALRLREAFRTQAQNYVDMFRIPKSTLAELAALVDMEGWENVDQALAADRGAIFAAAHLGNIDLVVQFACARGIAVTIPVEPLEPRALLDYVSGLRTAHGLLRLVPIDEGALAAIFQALGRNEVVGFAIDRDVQGTGAPTAFLGRRARLSHAPALVARRGRAPILPATVRRLPDGRFHARIHPAIWPARGISTSELMAAVTAPIEEAVRQTPGQWVMFQPLFEPPEAP